MIDKEPSPTPEPAQWPINGTLDLHLFQPKEVGDLVPEYLAERRKRGILQVRIVHGKGTGQLRERGSSGSACTPSCGGSLGWRRSAWRRKEWAGGARRLWS